MQAQLLLILSVVLSSKVSTLQAFDYNNISNISYPSPFPSASPTNGTTVTISSYVLCEFIAATNFGTLYGFTCIEHQLTTPACLYAPFVICDDDDTVTAISIGSLSVSGTIPTSLGMLQSLTNLDFSTNSMYGSIPSSLGLLSKVSNMWLNGNKFTGTIPSSLGMLSSVVFLRLDTNALEGTIPTSLGLLPVVNSLRLHTNKLTGTIPTSFGNLSNLYFFLLYLNSLTGPIPSSLGLMSNINNIILSYNKLTGTIPSSMGRLTNLSLFYIVYNKLTGSIPSTLGFQSSANYVRFSYNSLRGTIPSSLGLLNNLQDIELDNNFLTGKIPTSLAKLSKINSLILHDNQLTGPLPTTIGFATSLYNIHVYNNQLTGSLPSSLGSINKLYSLKIYNNKICCHLPTTIEYLSKLYELDVSYNKLSGKIPIFLGKLINLNSIYMQYNNITGKIPVSFGKMTNIEYVYIHHNKLTGTIPSMLYFLSSLLSLKLTDNKLSGTIPTTLALSSLLTSIDLQFNSLTGTIPPLIGGGNIASINLSNNKLQGSVASSLCVSSLTYLAYDNNNYLGCYQPCHNNITTVDYGTILTCAKSKVFCDIVAATSITSKHSYWNCSMGVPTSSVCSGYWNNVSCIDDVVVALRLNSIALTGSLPSSLGQLLDLSLLDMSDNALDGTLPTSLGGMSSLHILRLHDNQLQGGIPSSLSSLRQLDVLELHHNDLTGRIPTHLVYLTNLDVLTLSANQLSQSIPSSFISSSVGRLMLSYNAFTGTVPATLCSLSSLSALDLSNNSYLSCYPSCLTTISEFRHDALAICTNAIDAAAASSGSTSSLSTMALVFIVVGAVILTSSILLLLVFVTKATSREMPDVLEGPKQASEKILEVAVRDRLYRDVFHHADRELYTGEATIKGVSEIREVCVILSRQSKSLEDEFELQYSLHELDNNVFVQPLGFVKGPKIRFLSGEKALFYSGIVLDNSSDFLEWDLGGSSEKQEGGSLHSDDYQYLRGGLVGASLTGIVRAALSKDRLFCFLKLDQLVCDSSKNIKLLHVNGVKSVGDTIASSDPPLFLPEYAESFLCDAEGARRCVVGAPQAVWGLGRLLFQLFTGKEFEEVLCSPSFALFDETKALSLSYMYKRNVPGNHASSFYTSRLASSTLTAGSKVPKSASSVTMLTLPSVSESDSYTHPVPVPVSVPRVRLNSEDFFPGSSSSSNTTTPPTLVPPPRHMSVDRLQQQQYSNRSYFRYSSEHLRPQLSSLASRSSSSHKLRQISSLKKSEQRAASAISTATSSAKETSQAPFSSPLPELPSLDQEQSSELDMVPPETNPMVAASFSSSKPVWGSRENNRTESEDEGSNGNMTGRSFLSHSNYRWTSLQFQQDTITPSAQEAETAYILSLLASMSQVDVDAVIDLYCSGPRNWLRRRLLRMVLRVVPSERPQATDLDPLDYLEPRDHATLNFFIDRGIPEDLFVDVLAAYPPYASTVDNMGLLPVQYALKTDAPPYIISHLLTAYPQATQHTFPDDDTSLITYALQCSKSPRHIDVLLPHFMPIDRGTGEPLENHGFGWTKVLRHDHPPDLYVSTVAAVIQLYSSHIKQLAYSMDELGRMALNIATPLCKAEIIKVLYFLGRYDFKSGLLHRSATCVVRAATDTLCENRSVALKFMKHRDQFEREVLMREKGQLSDDFILSYLFALDGDADAAFQSELLTKGFSEYRYCIVMPEAEKSLQSVIQHEHIAGKDWDHIRALCVQIMQAVRHVHSRGLIHGDIKPPNIMRVKGRIVLIDLDACVSFHDGQYVGAKYSSGYIPPEMVHRSDSEAEGDKKDRVDYLIRTYQTDTSSQPMLEGLRYTLLPAQPSFDMWAVGVTLFQICTGKPLFLSDYEDNIDSISLRHLSDWTDDYKLKKLENVADPLARNFLSQLLNKRADRRPSAGRALAHPFLSGKKAARLLGEEPEFDVFLSYRVMSDLENVERLYGMLVARGLKVWWDKKCLEAGKPWEEGFCNGLAKSRTFCPVMSREAINSTAFPSRQNFSRLAADSPCDNVLLEYRLALELKALGMLELIFPVMVGDKVDGSYTNYFASHCHPLPSKATVAAVEEKVREHLDRQGLGAPISASVTVEEVLAELLLNQGGFVAGNEDVAFDDVVDKIATMIDRNRNRPGGLSKFKSSVNKVMGINKLKLMLKDDKHRDQTSELKEQVEDLRNRLAVSEFQLAEAKSRLEETQEQRQVACLKNRPRRGSL